MKEEFVEYLKSIGITDALMPRIVFLHDSMSALAQEEFLDVIVSEYVQEDSSRFFEDIRFFTSNFCVGAVSFIQQERYLIWNLKKHFSSDVSTINLRVENYDFQNAIPSSRIHFFCYSINPEAPMEIRTSGHNCNHFYTNIYRKHIYPHLKA